MHTAKSSEFVTISLDREDPIYKIGEKAVFTVKFDNANGETLNHTFRICITKEGGKEFVNCVVPVTSPMTVTFEQGLDVPGFLRMKVKDVTDTNPDDDPAGDGILAAAAFEPEKIATATPIREDVWDFWQNELAWTEATVPLDPKMELLPEDCSPEYNCYKVSFNTFDGRTYGFLSIPTTPGRHCAVVATHGTGPGYDKADIVPGAACMVLNCLPYDPRTPGKTLAELYEEANKTMFHFFTGGYNKKTYLFHRPIIGMVRAINWLSQQPFVEPTAMAYVGGSQGGGFGYYLASLSQKFSYLIINEPGMCDLKAEMDQRSPGNVNYTKSFRELDQKAGVTTDEKALYDFMDYYDTKNFAQHLNKDCVVRVVAGFIDHACPPSGIYAVFNSLQVADKQIFYEAYKGHGGNDTYETHNLWMREQLKKKEQSKIS